MKYIRTKDKIEKVPNDYANKLVECPNLVIADTIEELCDEFVYETSKGKRYIEKYLSHNNGIEIIAVYGAIWNNRGLKYIAKMNDKGELELL